MSGEASILCMLIVHELQVLLLSWYANMVLGSDDKQLLIDVECTPQDLHVTCVLRRSGQSDT